MCLHKFDPRKHEGKVLNLIRTDSVVFSISFVNSVANQVVVINGNGRLVDSINTILYRLHSVLNRSDASQMARSLMKDEGTRINEEAFNRGVPL